RTAVGEGRERDAGADHLAVQQDGARAADADAAPFLGAGEPQIVPEAVEERAVGRNFELVNRAVHREADHRATFSLSAKKTFSAVMGRSRIRTPHASATALATAGATALMLPSPMALALNGPGPTGS